MNILKTPTAYAAEMLDLYCGDAATARTEFWNSMRRGTLAEMPVEWLQRVTDALADAETEQNTRKAASVHDAERAALAPFINRHNVKSFGYATDRVEFAQRLCFGAGVRTGNWRLAHNMLLDAWSAQTAATLDAQA